MELHTLVLGDCTLCPCDSSNQTLTRRQVAVDTAPDLTCKHARTRSSQLTKVTLKADCKCQVIFHRPMSIALAIIRDFYDILAEHLSLSGDQSAARPFDSHTIVRERVQQKLCEEGTFPREEFQFM